MKVIYGITKSNFGGAQRYVFDLARGAQRAGHSVSVMVGGNGPLVEKLRNHGIKVIQIPHMQRDISLIDEIRSLHFIFRTLYFEQPDVFHTNSSKMGGIGNLAARLAGVRKIIFTGHAWDFNAPRPWWAKLAVKFFVWLTIALSHKTICVSEKTKRDVSGWPFIRNKLTVVHNGIEKFDVLPRSQARRELGIPEDEFVVGALSELHPVKGLDILLIAWEMFNKKHHAQLVLLGEGDQRGELEEFAELLDIKDTVTFKGYVEDARKYLSAFDLFCLPSRSEALPYTILEAGFAGAPVVATNVGGVPEIIDTGTSGVLIDPEEPDTLFSTLMLLRENKDLRKRLGEELKENVLKNFSAKKMAEKTLALY
jgi:glycosyltransferase involved in cell wall biosynthesis